VALRADKDMDWDQDTIELTWDHRSGFPNVSQASVTYVLTLKMCYLERRYIKCEVCHHLMDSSSKRPPQPAGKSYPRRIRESHYRQNPGHGAKCLRVGEWGPGVLGKVQAEDWPHHKHSHPSSFLAVLGFLRPHALVMGSKHLSPSISPSPSFIP
jgi:hypothetical protein